MSLTINGSLFLVIEKKGLIQHNQEQPQEFENCHEIGNIFRSSKEWVEEKEVNNGAYWYRDEPKEGAWILLCDK